MDETKSRENKPVVGNLQDRKDLANSVNQRVCPNCGYCPCCGRLNGNFNYIIWSPYPHNSTNLPPQITLP